MRAISLWKPWASALALGAKRIETRSWATTYRGPLAIHAAKRCVKSKMIFYGACWNWCGALAIPMGNARPDKVLPYGAVIATCELTDCRLTDLFTVAELDTPRTRDGFGDLYKWTERQMGDFSIGRFGWVLQDIRPLPIPIPFRGAQGLFTVPDAMLAACEKGGGE